MSGESTYWSVIEEYQRIQDDLPQGRPLRRAWDRFCMREKAVPPPSAASREFTSRVCRPGPT